MPRKPNPSTPPRVAALQRTLKELTDVKRAMDVASIVTITDANGVIIYVNDKFCEISKYSREELIGKTHRVVNSGYHSREFFRDLWQTVLSGKIWKGEIQNKAKDGTRFWLHSTIIPFLNDQGKPYQFVVIRNEITQRKEMEEIIKTLPQRIIEVQEKERERISREIHDDLGQSLATLKMIIQSSFSRQFTKADEQKKALKKTVEYIDTIIAKTRDLAAGLRPSTLEVLGISASLRGMVNDLRKHKGVKVHAHLEPLDGVAFKGEAINLYRIIQESLANIIRHSSAKNIHISVSRHADQLTVMIRDDGKGFMHDPQDNAHKHRTGLGLSTMRERARLLEGQFNIESKPGMGTTISLTIPVVVKGGGQ